ncbi:Sensor histidine kinase RcsC [Streptomyces antimycoticus]
MLRNLVVNAVEHGEGRDVVVRLATAGGAVAVAVRDYGVGLKPGEATRVFNRFWRADPARARTTGGTGLGLSIAVEDARLHGGWLQAWGEPGGGSQFRLTVPRTAGDVLRGSPIPLEPEDSRRNRRTDDAGARSPRRSGWRRCPRSRGPRCPPKPRRRRPTPTAPPGNWDRVVRGAPETPSDGSRGGRAPAARPTTSEPRGGPPGRDRADRRPTAAVGRRPAWPALSTPALLACGALLLSGCASMPDSGDVRRVDSSRAPTSIRRSGCTG